VSSGEGGEYKMRSGNGGDGGVVVKGGEGGGEEVGGRGGGGEHSSSLIFRPPCQAFVACSMPLFVLQVTKSGCGGQGTR